ncbi:MAG: hypothetical protein ACQEP8_01420 [Chlamydiota bacterium]
MKKLRYLLLPLLFLTTGGLFGSNSFSSLQTYSIDFAQTYNLSLVDLSTDPLSDHYDFVFIANHDYTPEDLHIQFLSLLWDIQEFVKSSDSAPSSLDLNNIRLRVLQKQGDCIKVTTFDKGAITLDNIDFSSSSLISDSHVIRLEDACKKQALDLSLFETPTDLEVPQPTNWNKWAHVLVCRYELDKGVLDISSGVDDYVDLKVTGQFIKKNLMDKSEVRQLIFGLREDITKITNALPQNIFFNILTVAPGLDFEQYFCSSNTLNDFGLPLDKDLIRVAIAEKGYIKYNPSYLNPNLEMEDFELVEPLGERYLSSRINFPPTVAEVNCCSKNKNLSPEAKNAYKILDKAKKAKPNFFDWLIEHFEQGTSYETAKARKALPYYNELFNSAAFHKLKNKGDRREFYSLATKMIVEKDHSNRILGCYRSFGFSPIENLVLLKYTIGLHKGSVKNISPEDMQITVKELNNNPGLTLTLLNDYIENTPSSFLSWRPPFLWEWITDGANIYFKAIMETIKHLNEEHNLSDDENLKFFLALHTKFETDSIHYAPIIKNLGCLKITDPRIRMLMAKKILTKKTCKGFFKDKFGKEIGSPLGQFPHLLKEIFIWAGQENYEEVSRIFYAIDDIPALESDDLAAGLLIFKDLPRDYLVCVVEQLLKSCATRPNYSKAYYSLLKSLRKLELEASSQKMLADYVFAAENTTAIASWIKNADKFLNNLSQQERVNFLYSVLELKNKKLNDLCYDNIEKFHITPEDEDGWLKKRRKAL